MDILFLLLGGNPLPNYVTAVYLLQKNRDDKEVMPVPAMIILISTKEAKDVYKDSILDLLELKEGGKTCQYKEIELYDKQRNPDEIQKEIKEELTEICNHQQIDSVHLNYSGGTKPMDINAFIAMREITSKRNIRLILSDLNPDNSKLIVPFLNKDNKFGSYPKNGDLRDHVILNINELLKLHNIKIKKTNKEEIRILKENLINIKEFGLKMSRMYRDGYRRKPFLDVYEKLKENGKKGAKKIIEKHPYLSGMFDKDLNMKIEPGHFYDFFNGKWLEYYILISLIDFAENKNIVLNSIERDIEASCNNRPMQIDVIAVKGYQMYLFSCTASQRIKSVKQKAFEALYRAEQLGGLHARVIVVSTMFGKPADDKFTKTRKNNIDKLKADLEQFDARQKCSLICLDELLDEKMMTNRLHEIIK